MNYGNIKQFDIANGEGVRVSLFVSGCTHHCKGCFNSETWDFGYGEPFTPNVENQIIDMLSPDYIDGLSLLGGEPFEKENQKVLLPFIRRVRKTYPQKSIWCYTGYTFDKDVMENMCKNWEETPELLSYIDVIVDGKFEEENKDIKLRFRGSSNQRIIDVKKSLKEKKAILFEF